MKTRVGFVSNSSSSSFIVAHRTDINDKELRQKIEKAIGVPKENTLLHGIVRNIVDTLMQWEYESVEDFAEDYEYTSIDLQKRFDSVYEWELFKVGRVCNDSGEASETILYDFGFEYQDEDLFIQVDN